MLHPNKNFNKLLQYVAEGLVLPVFFAIFTLLYDPFHILEYFSFGSYSAGFHIIMLSCIISVTLVPLRVIWYLLSVKERRNMSQQILWNVLEVFIIACFMALYTQLFRKNVGGWFVSLSQCLKYSFLTLCYPICITILLKTIYDYRYKLEKGLDTNGDTLVKLYDEHKRLKLTIAPVNILYIRAELNYVSINYLESNQVKEYMLRSSMKSIEASLSSYGIMRCHRSFLVNPKHINILAKDKDGFIYATLDTSGIPKIPVSKQYGDSLAELL